MKKYFSIFVITVAASLSMAQVVIGNPANASTDKSDVLLDFEKNVNKGLLLPTVAALPTSPANGTFLLDASAGTGTTARVRAFVNNSWLDLSLIDGNASTTRPTVADKPNSKAVIGASTSSVDGILVLESTTKAMVLPVVDNTDKIVSPSPGMMVYVKNASSDKSSLAVFNGSFWTFWAAN